MCRSRRWRTWCDPTEVGCRGFVGQVLCRALRGLGIRGLDRRKTTEKISDAAEKASRWLTPGNITDNVSKLHQEVY